MISGLRDYGKMHSPQEHQVYSEKNRAKKLDWKKIVPLQENVSQVRVYILKLRDLHVFTLGTNVFDFVLLFRTHAGPSL